MQQNVFARTGLYLDLRVQVIRPAALCAIADRLAAAGHNTIIVEWEASYPFASHREISGPLAYTREQVESFIRHCSGLGIEVIPLQQTFGHLEYILQHSRYATLREDERDPSQLCPCRADEALALFADLFADIAATHPGDYFHIGGDETRLLGHCPQCRKVAAEHGMGYLYASYFCRVATEVVRLGKRPVCWADMLLRYPEAAAGMPQGTVLMDWNYGWPVDHFGNHAQLMELAAASGFEVWGAPSLRCHPDNHSLTCWRTHLDNLRDFPPFARDSGYTALLTTSWSTSGVLDCVYDKAGQIIGLRPVRRVYPLNGFELLLDAFTRAVTCLGQGAVFAPEAFLRDYGQTRFGFTPEEAEAFATVLYAQAPVAEEADNLPDLLRQVRVAAATMAQLAERTADTQFLHLWLMADLRAFHVQVVALTRRLEQEGAGVLRTEAAPFTVSCEVIEALEREAWLLDERYRQLNRDFLSPEEIDSEIAYRHEPLQKLAALAGATCLSGG